MQLYVNQLVAANDSPAPPPPGRIIHPGEPVHFPDANELIEEIACHFAQQANELLDPGILAIIAETVP
jgi:hypothetical protein